MENYIRIYTGTAILSNRLAFLLNEINVPSILKDDKESGRLAGFGALENSTELHIFSSDIEKATEVVEKFRKEISQ